MSEHAYIPIKEYKKRKWGKDGCPPTDQAIRNQIKKGKIPAKKMGRDWFIDWSQCQSTGNKLVDNVLRGRNNGSKTKNKAT